MLNLKSIRQHLGDSREPISYTDPKTGLKHSTTKYQLARRMTSSLRFHGLLYQLIHYLKADTVLETGTALGISAACMAQTNAQKVVTIEGSPELAAEAQKSFSELSLTQVHLIEGPVQEVFAETIAQYRPQVVFLDADHRSETLAFYLDELQKYACVRCILVHDIYWSPDMCAAWKQVIANPGYALTLDLFETGMIFPDYPIEKQHFVLKF